MAHLRIVMATWHGAAHLDEQLASIAAQSHADWSLLVSDDGSTDTTRDIVADFVRAHPGHDIALIRGPGRGSAANFLSALGHDLPADAWLALSDQDDIWMPDRIARAVTMLQEATAGPAGSRPAGIYASRTLLMDADGRMGRPSVRHPRGPSFGNALVQNILAGNTMVLTPGAAELATETAAAAMAAGVAHHDWWLYALMAGSGARIVHDDRPGVYYRQHRDNHMGAHRSLGAARTRLDMIRDGRFLRWIGANLDALDRCRIHLVPGAADLTDRLRSALGQVRPGWPAILRLRRAGIRRQTLRGDLVLALALRQSGDGSTAPPSERPPPPHRDLP